MSAFRFILMVIVHLCFSIGDGEDLQRLGQSNVRYYY
jgi:hypothetical protein